MLFGGKTVSEHTDRLASHLPQVIVAHVGALGGGPVTPFMDTLYGAVLHAEITGITAFADRCMATGPEGVTQFHTLVDRYADQLFEVIRAHGGDLIAFSGDALTVLWPSARQALLGDAVLAALRCARQIQARLGRYEVGGGRRIGLRAGAGAGTVTLLHVGGVGNRWRLLLQGAAALEAQAAAVAAPPAAVYVGNTAWGYAEGFALGMRLRGTGWVHLQDISPEGPPVSHAAAAVATASAVDLGSYLSVPVEHQTEHGERMTLGALLHVRIGACGESLEAVNQVFQALQRVTEQCQGVLDHPAACAGGIEAVACFGQLPGQGEGEAVRAVLAALDLQEEMRRLRRPFQAGISTGQIIGGSFGGVQRRVHALIGDQVSLAAKLAQAAGEDGVLCDQQTAQAAGLRLLFDPLPPIAVKGKVEMVSVYRPRRETLPLEAAQRHGAGPALFGRDQDREFLQDGLDRLQSGEGGLLCLTGEAGMGKSALLGELMRQARERNVPVLAGAGDSFDQSTPYHVWRTVLMGALGLRPGEPLEQIEAVVRQRLADLGLQEHMAALSAIIAPGAEGPAPSESIAQAVTALIHGQTKMQGLLLVLEDAHWFDPSSWSLLAGVVSQVRPLLIVVTTRPLPEPVPSAWAALASAPLSRQRALLPLTQEEVEQLVAERLGVAAVPPAVTELIVRRAQGNPFFSEQIAYALVDAGIVTTLNGKCQLTRNGGDLSLVALPGAEEGMVSSRLAQLPPTQQLTLQVASLIGRLHAFRLLRDTYPIDDDRSLLADHLSSLQRLDLSAQKVYEPNLTYVFRHAASQETTYNLMLFAQRRQLHRAVAEWYERSPAEDLPRYYALLAYHYRRAEIPEKALLYADRAGEQALRSGAYSEAVTHLTEATRLGDDSTSNQQVAQWECQLAQALYGLGRWEESKTHFERAAQLLGFPFPKDAKTVGQAVLAEFTRQLGHRFGLVRGPKAAAERERLLLAARIYREIGPVYAFGKEMGRTLHAAVTYLNLAERAGGLTGELAGAYTTMCVALGALPLHSAARTYARRAREVAERSGDLYMLGNALLGTALYAYGTGDWAYGFKAITQAVEIYSSLGARRQYIEARSLSSLFLHMQGRLPEAKAAYELAIQAAIDTDDVQIQRYATCALVHCLFSMGQEEEAKLHLPYLEALSSAQDSEEALAIRWWIACAYWRAGLKPFPYSEAEAVMNQMLKRRPMEPAFGLLLNSFCEAYVTLFADTGAPALVLGHLRRLVRKLRQSAAIYPVCAPSAYYYAGRLALLERKMGAAKGLLARAIVSANQRSLPLEAALAHGALAQVLGTQTPLGREHLETARKGLAALGADHYLSLLPR